MPDVVAATYSHYGPKDNLDKHSLQPEYFSECQGSSVKFISFQIKGE